MARSSKPLRILALDIGGTGVKMLVTGAKERRKFPSGPKMTPRQMVASVRRMTRDWKYDVVSIGYPAPVINGRPIAEPHNLGKGWVGFDFRKAFGRPVRIMNDAAMQALGSYRSGNMLFLGLGTGLGTAMVCNGLVEPMELAHLPYKKGTFEDYAGLRGLEKYGQKKWQRHIFDIVKKLRAALEPTDIVIGGGNVHRLSKLPAGCRAGDNSHAFKGAFRLWEERAKSADTESRRRTPGRGGKSR